MPMIAITTSSSTKVNLVGVEDGGQIGYHAVSFHSYSVYDEVKTFVSDLQIFAPRNS